jgi:PAS domain S-box-containing protein
MQRLFIYFLMLFLPVAASGQHYNIKNYSIAEGLAQSQVQCLYQAANGYLWIGTLGGGVSRFDGRTFTNFTTREGLVNNQVYSIFEDAEHTIWFGTRYGVSRFAGRTFQTPDSLAVLDRCTVRVILADGSGHLWFGTDQGAWKYDGTRFRHFSAKEGLADDVILSMLLDREGRLWLGTASGLSRYDGTTFSNFSSDDSLAGKEVFSMLADRKGNLWFGTYGSLSRYDGKSVQHFTLGDDPNRDEVRAIIEDRDGILWLGTNGSGIVKFDGRLFTHITEKNGLSSNVVWALLADREANIWIGTYRGGLDQYRGGTFTYFSSKDGLGDDVIRWILEDRAGNLWFATFRGGVSRYDGKSVTTWTTRDGLIDNFVLTILEDRQGTFWFGTYKGVSRYDGKRFSHFSPGGKFPDQVTRAILEDRSSNFWFGTNNGGIVRYDGSNLTSFTTQEGLSSNQVNTLLEDREGVLWIGTGAGISNYNGKGITDISQRCGFKSMDIYAMIEGPQGNLWLGAYGDGVIRYSPRRNLFLEIFDSQDGLSSDNVVSLCFDDNGKLWIGTENGIDSLDTAAYETTGRKIFKHYGKEQGFTGIECIHNSICKDKDGNIWFGTTVSGAIKYNPHMDRPNLTEPITHITGLRFLFGEGTWQNYARETSPRSGLPLGLKLPYDKNQLALDFIGLSFSNPSLVKYQYRLEGFDHLWVPVSEGSYATYSNLPPGKYTFKVKASNLDGVWNKEPTSFAFEITPPFWQTWWFYLLGALLATGGIFTLIKIRTRHLERDQKILAEKVDASTRELKREKEKVEQINLELESRVRERTSELVEANRSLQEEVVERRVVEVALRESEEKFRLVVEGANDAVFIVQDGVIKFPNPRTVDMLGYSREELVKITFTDLLHPEDKKKVLERETNKPYTFRVIDKNQKELWVDLNSVSIQWEGKPAALNFFRDVTERKRLEVQLLEAQKMKAIGTMAGGLAHDFNNLLMGILGNVSLILSEIEPGHPYYSELKNIEQLVQNGAHLTRQLLGFAKGGRYEVKAIDLNEVIRTSAEMFNRTRKEIIFHEIYEENLWAVEVDRGQIEQVLLNLFMNAWQAMPTGGDIYLQTQNIKMDESDAQYYDLLPGHYIKVSVTDTGIGMDKDTRQRIFEPFFTTKEMGRGTGLGLASVYGIITNHGGRIHVYSEKGKGSRFSFYLPASEKVPLHEKILPENYLEGTETILLVDDEQMITDVGARLLKKMGYRVLTAESGKEALEIYEHHRDQIDIVILDMIMPIMGGGETYEKLKKVNPAVKVLLSSGYSMDGQAGEILKRGCKGFIQKPFRLKALSQKIRDVLDTRGVWPHST